MFIEHDNKVVNKYLTSMASISSSVVGEGADLWFIYVYLGWLFHLFCSHNWGTNTMHKHHFIYWMYSHPLLTKDWVYTSNPSLIYTFKKILKYHMLQHFQNQSIVGFFLAWMQKSTEACLVPLIASITSLGLLFFSLRNVLIFS